MRVTAAVRPAALVGECMCDRLVWSETMPFRITSRNCPRGPLLTFDYARESGFKFAICCLNRITTNLLDYDMPKAINWKLNLINARAWVTVAIASHTHSVEYVPIFDGH